MELIKTDIVRVHIHKLDEMGVLDKVFNRACENYAATMVGVHKFEKWIKTARNSEATAPKVLEFKPREQRDFMAKAQGTLDAVKAVMESVPANTKELVARYNEGLAGDDDCMPGRHSQFYARMQSALNTALEQEGYSLRVR